MIEPSFGANPFNLRLVQNCPVCRAESASAKVQILEELGSSFLAYLSCSRCGASLIVRVITMPQGLVGNAILTDLSSDEVVRFSVAEAVTEEFLLGAWQALAAPDWLAQLGLRATVARRLPHASSEAPERN